MSNAKTVTEERWVSIGDAAELTGVNPVTLRAWQRRFGLVTPKRTAKGHRLYGREHLAQIEEILYWLNQGVAISKIKPLLADKELAIANSQALKVTASEQADLWQQHINQLNQQVINFNSQGLNDGLKQLSSLYPFSILLNKFYWPWLRSVDNILEQRLDGAVIESWLVDELAFFIAQKRRFDKQGTHKSPIKPALLVALERTDKWSPLLLSAELSSYGVEHQLVRLTDIKLLYLLMHRLNIRQLFIAPHVQSSAADIRQYQALLQQLSQSAPQDNQTLAEASELQVVNVHFVGIHANTVNQQLGRQHDSVAELLSGAGAIEVDEHRGGNNV